MALRSDSNGFLIGNPMGDSEAERILSTIKGDTSKILALMRQQSRMAAAQRTSSQGRSAPSTLGSRATATPVGRAGYANRARDAAGRFVASPVSAPAAPAQTMADVANATAALARTAEAQRRDAKADRNGQARGKDGRFGSGGKGGGKGGFGGVGGSLFNSAGMAVQGGQQIDPLLAAIGEARGLASFARGVVSPVGRAGSSLFGGGGGVDQPAGLLRRMWRELRGLRKEEAKANKDTLRQLKDRRGLFGGSGGDGGGLMSLLPMLAGAIPALAAAIPGLSLLTKALGAGGAAAGGLAAGAGGALKGALKRLPFVGNLVEAISGVIQDQRIANDDSLSDEEKRRQRLENGGSSGGAIAGAMGGAALGSFLGPIGTVVGAIGGGIAGSSIGKRIGGFVSSMFESGGAGAGAISTGKGDLGGKSYGAHQLSSNTGTLGSYLKSSPYGAQFAGLAPGSPEFDAKWKALAASDPGFAASQHDFIGRTHVDPMMARLKGSGIDLSGRGQAVQEALFSTATQFGPGSDLIKRALGGADVGSMSDAAIVAAIQDYKIANNSALFKSSPSLQGGTLNRAFSEKSALLALADQAPVTPGLPRMPGLPSVAMAVAPGAAPQLESDGLTRLNSTKPAAAPAAAPASQDVRDRTIAHIVTGGIGGSIAHR